ncbi:MAG: hypothetical protein IT328_06955 [Caldilineaceae bacterium]|nr:hypothetical protein [Caldilineaceae bacterium]
MTTYIRGVYRDGVVHLRKPLKLANDTEVNVSVAPVDMQAEAHSERERIYAIFLSAGLVEPRSQDQPAQPPLTPERESELAEKLAQAGSLSELIIQEREEQDDRLLL